MTLLAGAKKPAPWSFDAGLAKLGWEFFHKHLVGAYLPLGQLSVADGVLVSDLSKFRQDATIENSSGDITLITTTAGNTLQFSGDATNDRIDLGSIPSTHPLSFNNKTQLSILFGIRNWQTPNSGFPRVIDKSDSSPAAGGWGLWFQTRLLNFNTFGAGNSHTTSGDIISVGETADLAYVMSALNSGQFYRNGIAFEGEKTTAQTAIPSNTNNAAIGNLPNGTDRMLNCGLDYVYVLDAKAPPGLILNIARDPFGPFRRRNQIFSLPLAADPVSDTGRIVFPNQYDMIYGIQEGIVRRARQRDK